MEIGNRNRSLEDADSDIVPRCFPSARIRFTRPVDSSGSTFSPALFYVGEGPDLLKRVFAKIRPVWVVPGN
jgi:hypothetical protein